MLSVSQVSQTFRFGIFELDSRIGELRRNGARLKIQDQPFHVLLKLLESPGEIVSREELKSALWAADTFVDFDTGLNTTIKRLREVLGDSADVPVFIETVPRRGYRFIAPVSSPPRTAEIAALEASEARRRSYGLPLLLRGVVTAALILAAVWFRTPLPAPRIVRFTPITSDGFPKANIITDGTRIYFTEMVADHFALSEVSVAGGEVRTLDSTAPGYGLFDISADGSKLLLASSIKTHFPPHLSIMDLPVGGVRAVGSIEAEHAVWAPDGRIVFSYGSEVSVVNADGSGKRRLFTAGGLPFSLSFSPDGARLRFTLNSELFLGSSIWEANSDGSGVHELFPHPRPPQPECCGKWTADGRYFVFARVREGVPQIWALEERHQFWRKAAPEPALMTSGPTQFVDPAPSRDGKKIFAIGSQPRAELVRYDVKSGAFVSFLPGLSAGDVETSHSHKSLVYVKYPEGTLWRSDLEGTNRVQLADSKLLASLAHWSPDDQRIAFSGTKPGLPTNIYFVSAEGGVPEKITSGPDLDLDPSWSPDGNSLAFGQLTPREKSFSYSIKLLDVKSRKVSDWPGGNGLCCPRWSPDGRFVVALNADGNQLMLFSFASQKWKLLADNLGEFGYLTWTPDSKFVVFDTMFAKEPFLYKVRIADSHVEPVVTLKDVRRFWGAWGPWTGLAPDGSPLLVRDVSNEEIYALDLELP